jgi:DNA mismatch endonuclease (patch repair protein)
VDARVDESRRRVDIAFRGPRVAVLVHGCFWHSCPEHGTAPRANGEWWAHKLAANRERDADTLVRLARAGWSVVIVWEHEDAQTAADRVERLVRPAQDDGAPA